MKRLSALGALSNDCLPVLIQSHSISAFQVHLHTHSITASKCIFKLARLQHLNPHNHGLQELLHTRLITASKCISKLARSRPPSASPNPLDHSLQVYLKTRSSTASKFARSWPPSASPKLLDHRFGVYLWVHLIFIFRCTSKCSQTPPAASREIPLIDG